MGRRAQESRAVSGRDGEGTSAGPTRPGAALAVSRPVCVVSWRRGAPPKRRPAPRRQVLARGIGQDDGRRLTRVLVGAGLIVELDGATVDDGARRSRIDLASHSRSARLNDGEVAT